MNALDHLHEYGVLSRRAQRLANLLAEIIPHNCTVLDVGSGHNPNPRSDVLCDRYVDDDTERGGAIRVDRPLIVGDGHNLPFKDKAFDYVIASHIIEHMDDPARFCSELMRVSKRGFIAR